MSVQIRTLPVLAAATIAAVAAAAATCLAVAPTAASAAYAHTVSTGESLSSVAAADGLTVSQLAAANGLSPQAGLVAGTTLMIPPQQAGTYTQATPVTGTEAVDSDGDGDASTEAVAAPTTTSAPAGGGSYIVAPGDTLSAIAARSGLTVASLAASNGLDPNGVLVSGRVLSLSGSPAATEPANASESSSSAAVAQPVGQSAAGSSSPPPYPTQETVSPSEVGSIAAANGVPASLAEAIADQESGFNNALTSSADARGVMQIMPGTWDWIGQSLAGPTPLAPASATSNVRAGVLLLHSLLQSTGGNQAEAAAGYYQGLPSVLRHGLYSDTQQYVNDVQALQQRFGGG
ncbi:MAG: LysM peptidoglycan-binding domain-containing protein [Solirubrobacteraceae bacterium]